MNKVVLKKKDESKKYYSPLELQNKLLFSKMKTAFIGEIETSLGTSYKGLFLISFECIIFAEDPTKTWKADITIKFIRVEKFVDVEIKVL